MAQFTYKASDARGKLHKGVIDARDQGMVARKLQEKALFPIKIESSGESKGLSREFTVSDIVNRVGAKDVLNFTGQLSTLLNAGLTLERSLNAMTDLTENPKFKPIVEDILKIVQGGATFADALSKYPQHFSKLYINMVRAGEAGGVLEIVMQRLNEFLEESQEIKDYITSAMIYPIFLIVVGGGAVVVLLTFVLPQFMPIFQDMGVAIPWYTQLLMTIADILRGYWWAIIAIVVAMYMGFNKAINTPGGRLWWDRAKLRMPVLGDLITKIEVARFSRTLGTLSTSGVPILNALNIVREIITNVLLEKAVSDAYTDIKEGGGVAKPLSKSGLFPPMAIHMMSVGEETGQLEEMLLKVADRYETEVRNAVKRAISLVEPVLIILMGLVVGSIVISMLMAIFSVNSMDF